MILVCTGDYSQDYNRTHIILKGLEHNSDITILHAPCKAHGFKKTDYLLDCLAQADIIFMPCFTHNEVPIIRKLTQKPIVFDPLISRYLTKVFDYKLVWKYSLRALKNYRKDSRALRNADVILTDTYAHKTYFSDTFNIPHSKMHVLPIGILSHDFIAQEKPHTDICTVGFYGGFIPLQGVRHIIETARIMQKYSDVRFELVGNGFEYDTMRTLAESYKLSNITFIGWVSYEELPKYIANWDICLGIFGNTHKANIVIPNKIYHYAAMKKAIITKKTDAIQELFTHTKDCILCNSNPLEIADCILNLKEQYIHKEQIAQNAYALITQNYNEHAIARMFVSIITNTCL